MLTLSRADRHRNRNSSHLRSTFLSNTLSSQSSQAPSEVVCYPNFIGEETEAQPGEQLVGDYAQSTRSPGTRPDSWSRILPGAGRQGPGRPEGMDVKSDRHLKGFETLVT